MSICRLREGNETSVSVEGGPEQRAGIPSLMRSIEKALADGGTADEKGETIRKLVVAYLKNVEVGRGEISPSAESFFRKVTGIGRTDTAPLSEGGDGRDFFRRITTK